MKSSLRVAVALLVSSLPGHSFGEVPEPLRVVTTEMEPFFYLADGEPAGIEYEILAFYAKAEGRTLQVRWVATFKDVLPALERGDADIAAAAITVTADRDRRFDFASPHFPSQLRLVEKAAYHTRELSELSGTTIGALAGSTSATALQAIDGVTVLLMSDVEELYRAVAAGEVRGIVSETARGFRLLQDYPTLEFGPALGETEQFAFALPEGSRLTQGLSEHVSEIKASGIYFELLEKHLGPKAVEIVQLAQK